MPSEQTLMLIILGGSIVLLTVVIALALRQRRLQARLAQRTREIRHLRRLVNGSVEAILVVDVSSGQVLDASEAINELAGLTVDDLVGRPATDLLVRRESIPAAADDPESFLRAWNRAREVELSRSDGQHVTTRVRAERLPDELGTGQARAVLYLYHDADRRAAEQARQHQEQLFERTVASLPCGFVRIDQAGQVVAINSVARRFAGITPDEDVRDLLERIARQMIDEDGRPMSRETIPVMRALATGRQTGPSVVGVVADDRTKWAQCMTLPIFAPGDDRPNGAMSILLDITDLRAKTRELEAAEERYRRVFRANPQPMWIFDQVTLRFLEVNDAAVRNYGYSREEFLAMTIEEIRPAEDRPKLRAHLRDSPADYKTSGPWRHRRKDGTIMLVEVFSHGIRFDNRAARFILATDVTERERALASLRESEERHRLVVELTDHLVYDYDTLSGAISWSGAAESVLGDPLSSLASLDIDAWADRLHPDDRVEVIDELNRCAAENRPFRVNYRMRRLDGSYAHVEDFGVFLRDDNGVQYRMLGTLHNISEQMEHERAIAENEERFRLAAEAARLGVWELDITSGRVTWLGRTAEVFGMDLTQFSGQLEEFFRCVHGDDRARVRQAMDKAIRKGVDYRTEYRWIHPDGGIRWIASHGTVVHDARGRAERMLGVVRDITEQREAEERQRLLMDELDHRVKNNLAAVATIAEQTLSTTSSMEQFRTAFSGRLVALARTHEALARANWKGIDLHQAVELVLGAYLMSNPPRIRYEGDRIRLPARAGMPICLALHELATNAVKYGALSDATGVVNLSWSYGDDGSTVIEWRESGGPAVHPPSHSGMGRRLIEGLIVYELRGEVDISFPESGVVCRIRLKQIPGNEAATGTEKRS